jgi:alpha-amylase/alpha-mannosidase (GH57 family)
MRYVCIHGHFYQPPRENPSLEYVELQDSAYPYHDWNERITAECYAPNAASRIMDADDRIVRIMNNYSRISFNFGPTLLSWLQEKAPPVYASIQEADKLSRDFFSGHGSAIAQAYNHMIMPLANSRDKRTQVIWGLRDFQNRFGRMPEGMWLPETAVDLETLEILAEFGIKYTILAPRQASRVRKIGGRTWKDVSGDRIDPTRAYQVRLPSRRRMSLFFYDGPIARAVAFEGLLNNGEHFANRLLSGFSDTREWDQLLHIATDGESYGHHHHFGEMALSYALDHIEHGDAAKVTNYGEFLEKYPPTHQVEIFENSSWSCVHGVERWRSNCGCNSGGRGDWDQTWRAPLRAALDWLRDAIAPCYEEKARTLLKDPWAARNDYVNVILDRSPQNLTGFFAKHALRELQPLERVTALKLLEMQRHAMLMYTSCGWFFDELSGIETVQVIHYAGRALQLAMDVFDSPGLEALFLSRLAEAHSNLPEHKDGAAIYEKFVKPAVVDLPKLAAHYAIRSTFEPYADHAQIYSYTVDREELTAAEQGKLKLVTGRARFTSRITEESSSLGFAVLNFGDHNVSGGVRKFSDPAEFTHISDALTEAFNHGDSTEVLRLLDASFDHNLYSLKSLFRDDQRKILEIILESTLAHAEAVVRQQYGDYAPLMRFLADLHVEQPKLFRTLADSALNSELQQALKAGAAERSRALKLIATARSLNLTLEGAGHEFTVRKQVEEAARTFAEDPLDLGRLQALEESVRFAQELPFRVNLWEVQNLCFQTLSRSIAEVQEKAAAGDEAAKSWLAQAHPLADRLRLRVN